MAVALGQGRPEPAVNYWVRWGIRHIASFEMLFMLFLYSNYMKMFLPPLPVDETLLFGALSLGMGAIVFYKNGLYERGLPVVGAGLLFIIWVALSYTWTPSPTFSVRSISYLSTFTVWCILGSSLIIASSRERVLRLLLLHVALALLFAGYGAWIFMAHGQFRYWSGFAEYRRVYIGWGYTTASGAAVLFLITIYARFLSLKQMLALVAFGICMYFLLNSGSRGGLLAAAAACALPLLLTTPTMLPRGMLGLSRAQVIAGLLVLLAGGYIAYLVASGEASTTLGRFIKLMNAEEAGGPQIGTANRMFYWPFAFSMWEQAPLIGNGIASFTMFVHGREVPGAWPHNIILEIMAELGLVGLILFGLFLGCGLIHAKARRLRDDPLLLCTLMLFVTVVMAGMFSVDIAGNRRLFAFLGLLTLPPAVLPRRS